MTRLPNLNEEFTAEANKLHLIRERDPGTMNPTLGHVERIFCEECSHWLYLIHLNRPAMNP